MNTVLLQATMADNLDFAVAAETDPENVPFVGQWTKTQHLQSLGNGDYAHFMVINNTERQVGHVILQGRQDPSRNLLLKRIVITEKGQGYGRAALQAVQQKAFEDYQVHRLWLDVIETNARARHLYRSAGFVEEGILREALLHHGQHISLVIMSVLAPEYRKQGRQP